MINQIKEIIDRCFQENPCRADVRYNEPMKEHTTFKVGGPADCWVSPDSGGFPLFCAGLLKHARKENIPLFIAGGGANIVVSDKGIRGIVLDTNSWTSVRTSSAENFDSGFANENELTLKSGTSIDEASGAAAAYGFSGMEFLAGMPGTIGGAVWMNARCYGKEIADVLKSVEIIVREQGTENKDQLTENGYVIKRAEISGKRIINSRFSAMSSFAYKQSPFQEMDCLILSASFSLKKGDKENILIQMEKNRKDRQDKGHYLFPCAGSVFKNNPQFGKPAGLIIDELGLKGLKKGGAQIAPFHGNIIINNGNASASDIRSLVDEITRRVKEAAGFVLEPEIIFAGQW